MILLSSCAASTKLGVPATGPASAAAGPLPVRSFWQSDAYIVLVTDGPATASQLAAIYLKDARQAWKIEEANRADRFEAGREVVIPLVDRQPLGIGADGYQTVPILCYHRFGNDAKNKLVLTAEEFDGQMAWLQKEGYRVIPLSHLEEFLAGKRALPRRAVVITVDDGFRSFHEIAFPILVRYGYPATLFIYSDYIGGGPGALTWEELKKMEDSGLIDTQNHSKTHADLTALLAEGRDKVKPEIMIPADQISRRLGHATAYLAYPYGKTNPDLIALLKESGQRLALTVDRGSNAFFADPWLLRRNMVFAGDEGERFRKLVSSWESLP